ncbi:hypothetical protein ACFLS1_01145 [Verrucomicrobiota bacterium]
MNNILEFDKVTFDPESYRLTGISDVSFSIVSGSLTLILFDQASEHTPIFDLAQGLISPDSGSIKFLGKEWGQMDPFRQSEMRGKAGRVFTGEGWVSNLTVYENVTLSAHHHTLRSEDEIREEVLSLAKCMGLDQVSELRPDVIRKNDLKRSQCVRAFLGKPVLILLEQPELGLRTEDISQLINLVEMAAKQGSGIIWITLNNYIWNDERLSWARRFMVQNGKMISSAEVE